MSTSRISELAQRIATNTAKIDYYLISQGLPQPSFELDAPLKSVIPENEVEIKKARQELLDDTLELRSLIQGPRELMSSFSVSSLHANPVLPLCTKSGGNAPRFFKSRSWLTLTRRAMP